jgi:hypothetical protein
MADDAISAINKAETFGILALLVVIGYAIYKGATSFGCTLNQLFGLPCSEDQATAPGGSYVNALNQTVSNPISTIGTILTPSGPPSTNLPTLTSSVGYQKIGASGQVWNCTGPRDASNDMCYPVTLDGDGNPTITGAAIHASQAN